MYPCVSRAQTCAAIRFVCESDVLDDPAHQGFWIPILEWNRYRHDTYKDNRQAELKFIRVTLTCRRTLTCANNGQLNMPSPLDRTAKSRVVSCHGLLKRATEVVPAIYALDGVGDCTGTGTVVDWPWSGLGLQSRGGLRDWLGTGTAVPRRAAGLG